MLKITELSPFCALVNLAYKVYFKKVFNIFKTSRNVHLISLN